MLEGMYFLSAAEALLPTFLEGRKLTDQFRSRLSTNERTDRHLCAGETFFPIPGNLGLNEWRIGCHA
ncbi:hypothetical protein OUZ56_021357 [Daphnia magna]|uniref:Uncharacterized protein n=1 Tax=Daphnia magna TaxID=35525 RepID=A0ABQ9ZH54_9CRUS|nr:hypothetical protein OUZ56_021357 [Daphnia magna]